MGGNGDILIRVAFESSCYMHVCNSISSIANRRKYTRLAEKLVGLLGEGATRIESTCFVVRPNLRKACVGQLVRNYITEYLNQC